MSFFMCSLQWLENHTHFGEVCEEISLLLLSLTQTSLNHWEKLILIDVNWLPKIITK